MGSYSNFAYAGAFSAAMNVALAAIVFRRTAMRALSWTYLAAAACIAVWCAGAAALFVIATPGSALAVAYVLHVAVLFLPATTLHLTLVVSGFDARRIRFAVYAVTLVLLASMPFGQYILGVRRLPHTWFAVAGPGFVAFSALLPTIAIPMLAFLARRRRTEQVNKRRYTVLMAANALMIITGVHDCLPAFGIASYPHTGIAIYPWGTFAATFYGALFAYAALQDHALDVRFDVGRNVAAFLRLAITFGVGFVLLFAVSVLGRDISPLLFGVVLGTLLVANVASMIFAPPLLAAISSSLHAQALSASDDYRARVVRAAETTLSLATYNEIWGELRAAMSGAMRIEMLAWIVVDARRGQLIFSAAHPVAELNRRDGTAASPMFAVFDRLAAPCFDVASAGMSPDGQWAAAAARRLGGEFVFVTPGAPDVRGVLVVGHKTRGYSRLDLELLTHVAERLGIAAQRVCVTERAGRAERHELLSVMGRGLAHDLQNLIVPVRTFLDVLRRSPHLDERERTLQAVAADNVAAIGAYLANAVLFGADMRLRLAPTTPATIVAAAGAAVAGRAKEKQVELRLCTDRAELLLDPVLGQRLIANLLANAIDASPFGGVVDVLSSKTDPGGGVRFEVHDRGHGIPVSIQRSLFQPYFTTKGSGGDGQHGFGLGLALCQMIVELHDGRIWFQSVPGAGTSFFVELPHAPKAIQR